MAVVKEPSRFQTRLEDFQRVIKNLSGDQSALSVGRNDRLMVEKREGEVSLPNLRPQKWFSQRLESHRLPEQLSA
jgi:hypothetical protein